MSPIYIIVAVLAVAACEWAVLWLCKRHLCACWADADLGSDLDVLVAGMHQRLMWQKVVWFPVLSLVYFYVAYLGLTCRSDFLSAIADLFQGVAPWIETLCAAGSSLLAVLTFWRLLDRERKEQTLTLYLCHSVAVAHYAVGLAEEETKAARARQADSRPGWAVGLGLVGSFFGPIGTLAGIAAGTAIGAAINAKR